MPLRSFVWLSTLLFTIAVPTAAFADQSGTATLTPNAFLNLETGAVSNTRGDILWSGGTLTPQAHAGVYKAGKYGARGFKSIPFKYAAAAPYSTSPIPSKALVPGDVFGVHTMGGHYAKVLVTASDGVSLSLEYTVFSSSGKATGAANAAPAITMLQNNYSFLLPGVPNYGIAPGSLFVILGTGLSVDQPAALQSSAAGLPTTLNQTSVAVTVNGTTTHPALYYTSATALGAVLPSTTPVGNGTITVTYNGTPSTAAQIHVTASAVGLDTLYGTGNGSAVVTDARFNALVPANSAMPGQGVVFWGTGVGADTNNADTTFPQTQDNLTNIPMQVWIGGVSADILYRGRSQYPGLDQINVLVPNNVPLGCFVSVIVQTGNITSNSVTMPISQNGGACTDPATGLTGTQIQTLANKGSVNGLGAAVFQNFEFGKISAQAIVFPTSLGGANFGKGYEYASQGSCIVIPPEQGSIFNQLSILDAGTSIQLNAPGGNQALTTGNGPGYGGKLPLGPLAQGAYTFTGTGGNDIGKFTASVNVQGALSVTNSAALNNVTRSQGVTVTWSGGFAGGDVQVSGDVGDQYGSIRYYCHAPSSAGQITVPPYILLAIPAGPGELVVQNTTPPQSITATGVDFGIAVASAETRFDITYK